MRSKLNVIFLSVVTIGSAYLIWRIWTGPPIFRGTLVTEGCHRDATGTEVCQPPFKP
jgi:hypothetical protein